MSHGIVSHQSLEKARLFFGVLAISGWEGLWVSADGSHSHCHVHFCPLPVRSVSIADSSLVSAVSHNTLVSYFPTIALVYQSCLCSINKIDMP